MPNPFSRVAKVRITGAINQKMYNNLNMQGPKIYLKGWCWQVFCPSKVWSFT